MLTASHKHCNHNYNKILKSDWLSTALISALIGQSNRTVRVLTKQDITYAPSRASLNGFFSLLAKKSKDFLYFDFKKSLIFHKFC